MFQQENCWNISYLKNYFVVAFLTPIDLYYCVLSLNIVHRYLWKIFKGPPRCWCKHWQYAKNTWTTPSRASLRLLLDSYVVSIKDHSPRTMKFTTMIAKPSKVAIVDWEAVRISKSWKSVVPYLCHTYSWTSFPRAVVYQRNVILQSHKTFQCNMHNINV